MIAVDPFANSQHFILKHLFNSFLAFFDRIGFLKESLVESSPFVRHWDDLADTDSD